MRYKGLMARIERNKDMIPEGRMRGLKEASKVFLEAQDVVAAKYALGILEEKYQHVERFYRRAALGPTVAHYEIPARQMEVLERIPKKLLDSIVVDEDLIAEIMENK